MKSHTSEVIPFEIASMVNTESGEAILFINNKKGGPIVFGKTMDDAKRKMKEAFSVSLIAASFIDTLNANDAKVTIENMKLKLNSDDLIKTTC
ncbi:MAG: hypothetical protein ACRC3B_12820 [Bacteroidia bacterium]